MKTKQQTIKEIHNALLADGWREYHDLTKPHATSFYKSFPSRHRCHGNSDKTGVQIQASVSRLTGQPSIELSLCAGLPDDTWISLLNYGLPQTVPEALMVIPGLIATWEAMNDYVQNVETKVKSTGISDTATTSL